MDKIMQRYEEIKLNNRNLVEKEQLAFCVNDRFLETREQLILEYGKLSSYLAFDSGYTYARYQRLSSILKNISEKIDDFDNLNELDILVLKKMIVYLNLDLGLSVSFYSVFENMVLSEEFHFIKNNLKVEYDYDALYKVMCHKEKEKKRKVNQILDIPSVPVYDPYKLYSKTKKQHINSIGLSLQNALKSESQLKKPRVSLERQVRSFSTRFLYLRRLLDKNKEFDNSEKELYMKLLILLVQKKDYSVVSNEYYMLFRKVKTFLESKVGAGISDIEMYNYMINSGELDIDVSKFDNAEELLSYLGQEFGLSKKQKRR